MERPNNVAIIRMKQKRMRKARKNGGNWMASPSTRIESSNRQRLGSPDIAIQSELKIPFFDKDCVDTMSAGKDFFWSLL